MSGRETADESDDGGRNGRTQISRGVFGCWTAEN